MSLLEIGGFKGLNEWYLIYMIMHIIGLLSAILCLNLLLGRGKGSISKAIASNYLAMSYTVSLIFFHPVQILILTSKGIYDFQPGSPVPSQLTEIIIILICDNISMATIDACIITGTFFFINLVVKLRSGSRPFPKLMTSLISSANLSHSLVAVACLVSIITFAVDHRGYLPVYYLNMAIEIIAMFLAFFFGFTIAIELLNYYNSGAGKGSKSHHDTLLAFLRLFITSVVLFLLMATAVYAKHISNIVGGTYTPYGLQVSDPVGFSIPALIYTMPGINILIVFRKKEKKTVQLSISTNERIRTLSADSK